MRKRIAYKWLATFALALLQCSVIAQPVAAEQEAVMRSNNKIYVVLAVCLTILIGLFLYLFSVERKISKLEQ